MRKINFFIVLVVFVLAACASEPETKKEEQETVTEVSTETVEVDPSFEEQTYSIPTELEYVRQKFDFIYQRFYPIGWSAKGHFAYVAEPADEACGCYFFELIIQDMVSDSQVYRYSYNDQGQGENLKSVWKKNKELFQEKLNAFGIEQDAKIELSGKSFKTNNQTFKIQLSTTVVRDSDFMLDVVKSYKLSLKGATKTKSVLAEQVPANDAILNMVCPGVMVSPFEPRVAMLVQEERRGFEGPPNVLSFKLVGSSLNKGF